MRVGSGRFTRLHVAAACVLVWAARAGGQTTVYSTGFEAPTFASGSQLVGQQEWVGVAPAPGQVPPLPPNLNPTAALITTDGAASGSQAVRVLGSALQTEPQVAPYAAVGSYRRPVNFNASAPGVSIVTVQSDVRLDGPLLGAGDFASATVTARAGEGTAGEIGISSDGRVYAYAPNAAPGSLPVLQAPISLGQFHTLGVRVDFGANNVQYLVDGSPLGGAIPLPATFTSDLLSRGSIVAYALPDVAGGPQRSNYTFRYDNFSITAVPEPAALALPGLAALALLRRRPARR